MPSQTCIWSFCNLFWNSCIANLANHKIPGPNPNGYRSIKRHVLQIVADTSLPEELSVYLNIKIVYHIRPALLIPSTPPPLDEMPGPGTLFLPVVLKVPFFAKAKRNE